MNTKTNTKKTDREILTDAYGEKIASAIIAWRKKSPVNYKATDSQIEKIAAAMADVPEIKNADDAELDTEVETHKAFSIVFNEFGCWIYRAKKNTETMTRVA